MDLVWKIGLGIVLLPFFLWGLSMLLQFLGLAGTGIFATFSMVWDKDNKLSFKEGLGIGLAYVILGAMITGLFWWLIGIRAMESSGFFQFIKGSYEFLALGLIIVSLIRLKFKFAGGYISSVIINSVLLQGILMML